jgi:molybdopterin converting factor small subunit
MQVTVRLGEPFWRAAGTRDLTLELPAGATVAAVLAALCERVPALARELHDAPPQVFAGEEEVAEDAVLAEGARVHLLWPVAGG